MNKLNLIHEFKRWRTSHKELLNLVDTLRKDNDRLRVKLTALQHAKDQAEKDAEERRREKESLRVQLADLKKALKSKQLSIDQLSAKLTELRDELDRMKQPKR
jgi:chromosome segregation ATPase